MERRDVFNNIGHTARRLNGGIVEKAPKILRLGGAGFGLGALAIDQNWVVAGLS